MEHRELRHIVTFCGSCSCGCPSLYLDEHASPDRRIVITDDFGQHVQMSVDQLRELVDCVRSGALDSVV